MGGTILFLNSKKSVLHLKLLLSLLLSCFVFACGGGGGSDSSRLNDEIPIELGLDGPDDRGNYFPLQFGNLWLFEGTKTTAQQTETYQNFVSINGTKTIDDLDAFVIEETNAYGEGSFESYIIKDLNGIVNLGSSDFDVFGTQLSNYWEVRFPLIVGESFVQLDRTELNYGEDLDGDGLNESFDIRSVVTVIGLTDIQVPAGFFEDVVHVRRDIKIDLFLSFDQSQFSATAQENVFFAPEVGWIERSVSISLNGDTQQAREVLAAYVVNGQSAGITRVPGAVTDGIGNSLEKDIYYLFDVLTDIEMTISLTGLTGEATLVPIFPDQCIVSNIDLPSITPEDCQIKTTSNRLAVAVNGQPGSKFTLSVAPKPQIETPANEGSETFPVAVSYSNPRASQVGAGGTSFYSITNLSLKNYTVSISGLSSDADLELFKDRNFINPYNCISRIGDVPEDCTTVDNVNELYFRVRSAGLAAEGSSYLILVR